MVIHKLVIGLKIICYFSLAVWLGLQFIGIDILALIFNVNQVSEQGVKQLNEIIPKQILFLTLITATLEVVDNLINIFSVKQRNI